MKPKSRRPGIILASLALLAVVCGVLAWTVFRPTPERFATVDLTTKCNGELHVGWVPDGRYRNHLGAMPRGHQTFLGVPFDVRGVVQLQGQVWKRRGYKFPEAVKGLPVDGPCRFLHLLHADSSFGDPPGTTVAKLVLHYANGQQEELDIRQGEQVLDWQAQSDALPADPGTAVAWTGENPESKKAGRKIRIFKTRFANPHPRETIEDIDYVSAMAGSAPFMVALTVERY
jgi:hypothetical protein